MSKGPTTAEDVSVKAKPTLDQIELQGEVRVLTSVSMLFTDILSQELNSALSTPDTVTLIQKHIQNRPMDQLTQRELQPLFESVPDSILNIAKEAAFSAGALVKRIPCEMPLHVGDRFMFRGSGLMAQVELKDGRVVNIQPLLKR